MTGLKEHDPVGVIPWDWGHSATSEGEGTRETQQIHSGLLEDAYGTRR